MTQKAAVFQACDELGGRCKVSILLGRAEQIYGGTISYTSSVHFRSLWRLENDQYIDCRTYAGQPRRNMLNDQELTPQQQQRLKNIDSVTIAALKRLVLGNGTHRFHSVEQLLHGLTQHSQAMKAAA